MFVDYVDCMHFFFFIKLELRLPKDAIMSVHRSEFISDCKSGFRTKLYDLRDNFNFLRLVKNFQFKKLETNNGISMLL